MPNEAQLVPWWYPGICRGVIDYCTNYQLEEEDMPDEAEMVTVKHAEYAVLLLIAETARDYTHDPDIRRLLAMLTAARQEEPTDAE